MNHPHNPLAVAIENLSHWYPRSRRQPARRALHKLNLSISNGTFFVLTGPNGSGKSTLFRILCGLAKPSAGSIAIHGHDLISHPQTARHHMGVVFQKPALDKYLTVMENLRIHADLYDLAWPLFENRLEAALTWSDLKPRLNDRVETLSGGLARQVELVKVLLHAPTLLILDEPTVGLDPGGRLAFMNTLLKLQQEQRVTILMTSHIFAEAQKADQVAILQQGSLLTNETPAKLKAKLGHEILVIQGEDLALLENQLSQRADLTVQSQNKTLRIQGGDLLQLMTELLQEYREQIHTLSIKQPDLEDVYIHLTGRPLDHDEEKTL